MKRSLGVSLFVVCLGLAYLDTKGYRDALDDFASIATPEILKADRESTKKDVEAIIKCRNGQGELAGMPDERSRDCIIPALHAIRSENGAVVGVTQASLWLIKNPRDDDMRRAAMAAMSHGWEAYKRSLPLYIAQQRVIDARRKSFILRLADQGSETGSLVDFRFEHLRQIEAKLVAAGV